MPFVLFCICAVWVSEMAIYNIFACWVCGTAIQRDKGQLTGDRFFNLTIMLVFIDNTQQEQQVAVRFVLHSGGVG